MDGPWIDLLTSVGIDMGRSRGRNGAVAQPTQGVLYVASNHDRYVEEAFLSAESLKRRCPGTSVTLFTDRPDNALCGSDCFDSVLAIPATDPLTSDWAEGQLKRIACLRVSPYAQTLHIDTDTRIISPDVAQLFSLLENVDVAMVEDPPDKSYARRLADNPMFNGGLLLYRQSEKVAAFLAEWQRLTRRNFIAAESAPLPDIETVSHIADEVIRRNLLRIDQIAFTEIFSPTINTFGLAVTTLDAVWNYRGSRHPDFVRASPKILHLHEFKAVTRAGILKVAEAWQSAGRAAESERLYDYVGGPERPRRTQRLPGLSRWFGKNAPPAKIEEWSTPTLKRGYLHLHHHQFETAANIFASEVHNASNNALALAGLGEVALATSQTARAVDLLREAALLKPKSPLVNRVLGQTLLAAGKRREAVIPLKFATKAGDDEAPFFLGQAYFAENAFEKAADAYDRSPAGSRNHFGARSNYVQALLGCRHYEKALDCANALLEEHPWHVRALAFKSVALVECGKRDEAAQLSSFENLVRVERPNAPPAFADLRAFLAEAAAEIVGDQSLRYEPAEHTTRRGQQTRNLAAKTSRALEALHGLISAAVADRISAIAGEGGHPFERARPRSYRIESWGTVLGEGGHQTPHIHSSGWLSGVYYIEVPEGVIADDPDRSGWLKFGRSDERWHRPETIVDEHYVFPEPGMLVTFPSFLWHSTVPLRTNARRISFAFDVIPA
ncbi:MAG: 2OG-Fe(II) oxygenase family protein [Candidatus Binataceae bacterium]